MFLRKSAMKWSTLKVGDIIGNVQARQILPVASHKRYYSSPAGNIPSKDVVTSTASDASAPSQPSTFAPPGNIGRLTHHRVNKLERFFLVWGGNYKTMAEVPDHVSQDTLERARNKARIKFNLMMAAATLFACLLMVYLGKKARNEGVSVVKINEEWHKRINEEAKAAQASK